MTLHRNARPARSAEHSSSSTCVRAYRRRANGKAERFIKTLLAGWEYGAIYRSTAERQATLAAGSTGTTPRRPHGSLSHKPPSVASTS